MSKAITGYITRVLGPIIYARGMSSCGLYDVVEIGKDKLIGEIIRLSGEEATIQVYEDDTGLHVGDEVICLLRPLSIMLGPGLVGNIYDGIQRPLSELFSKYGHFLNSGEKASPLDDKKKWHFIPSFAKEEFPIQRKKAFCLGFVQETSSVKHKIMIPPHIEGKSITFLASEGDYTINDVIAKTELGEDIYMAHYWSVRKMRPFAKKLTAGEPLLTGTRVIDVFFPIAKGGVSCIPGGFGTGKTMTQHAIAKWCNADIIVYIGCGERGNEMTDVLNEFPALIDPKTGRSLMERTILIANTSNMPVAAREMSLYSGVTIAEYYRDMGLDVAIMADSTSRWTEALRELSGRMEEMPAEEGFPAYLPTRLAEFYERAGLVETFDKAKGSVSIIGAVSPPGGDFSEPVTGHTKRFVRCFWGLDRELANSRHYPAISWISSYSEYAEQIKDWWNAFDEEWARVRLEALGILKREQKLEQIVHLIGEDALPDTDRILLVCCDMIKQGFLQQNSFDDLDMFSAPHKQVMIITTIIEFYRHSLTLIKSGCPLYKVMNMKVKEEIIRMKSKYENNDIDGMKALIKKMDDEFDELAKMYRRFD
ncbi:MAG: V-type ATP synthase subunit A [Treponema sp.]